MTHGTNKTIINKNTGAVMYVDMLRSYNFNPGPPPILPSDIAAKGIADSFLASNGISTDLIYGYNVSEISANLDSIGKGQFSIGQKMPFQKRVNYQRGLSVMEQTYPVVGPGGKIIVMVDEYGDTRYFVKIWRQLEQAEDVMLSGANLAIQKFHELGPAALILCLGLTHVPRVQQWLQRWSPAAGAALLARPPGGLADVHLRDVTIELTPPPYTHEAPGIISGGSGSFAALPGTRVFLEATAPGALDAVAFQVGDGPWQSGEVSGDSLALDFVVGQERSYRLRGELAAGGEPIDSGPSLARRGGRVPGRGR